MLRGLFCKYRMISEKGQENIHLRCFVSAVYRVFTVTPEGFLRDIHPDSPSPTFSVTIPLWEIWLPHSAWPLPSFSWSQHQSSLPTCTRHRHLHPSRKIRRTWSRMGWRWYWMPFNSFSNPSPSIKHRKCWRMGTLSFVGFRLVRRNRSRETKRRKRLSRSGLCCHQLTAVRV